MKIINNSIDSENLEDSISEVDLENQMANCEVKPEMMNGHTTDRLKISDRENIEEVKKSTLLNGVNKLPGSPAKCNGKVNGFYEEEDFNLVLEDSSEGGDSPLKKIDDESLSAPQIVQEIEDLLGINSSSAVIQEELSKLDGSGSIDENLDLVEDYENQNQDLKEATNVDNEKIEEKDEIKESSESAVKSKECVISSKVNLMFDEVEVGMEKGDSKTLNECSTMKESNVECTDGSSTKVNANEVEDCKTHEIKENDDVSTPNKITLFENQGDELPLTQSSGISGASEEWMVLDSVETSEDEHHDTCTEVKDVTEDTPPASDNLNSEAIPSLAGSSVSIDERLINDSDSSQVSKENATVELEAEVKDTSEMKRSTPLPSLESEKIRKRNASENEEENIESKKQKLEEPNHSIDTGMTALKRPSQSISENESKRTKVHETANSEPLKSENEQECEIILDTNKSSIEDLEKQKETNACGEENLTSNNSVQGFADGITANVSSKEEDEHLSSKIVEEVQEKNVSEENVIADPTNSEEKTVETNEKVQNDCIILDSDNEMPKLVIEEECEVSDENKENVSSETLKEKCLSIDELASSSKTNPTKLQLEKNEGVQCTTFDTKKECSKVKSLGSEISSSIRDLEEKLALKDSSGEKSLSGHERVQGLSNTIKNPEPKKKSNLELSIDRAVEKTRILTEKKVPILKKFHKDQLKKLKRSQLEEIVVSKICEAVSYKSEIGQMRLRTQNLEETNDMWRKKVQQIEKQNKELEMVLKRFLNEIAQIKRENQNKVPMPVKVTRSVGLQVVLASSMHGALVSSKSKQNNESSRSHEHHSTKTKQVEKESAKEPVKSSTYMPTAHSSFATSRKGRPSKTHSAQNSRSTTPQTYPSKVSQPSPAKPVVPTPAKDLEVIDLTDREERARAAQTPVGGQIRVAPSTQVCFVQQSPTTSPPQQPLYLVQKTGQRQQFLVATSTPSPQRPVTSTSRPPPALALPVFRTGGHLIPVQTTPSPPASVKPTPPAPSPATVARVSPALRMQQQANKHPAPLPPTPIHPVSKTVNMKAPPPKPQLKIAKTANGIMLSWSMSLSKDNADMQSYQLYAYQEGDQPPSTGLWKKVGDVKALPLPMACTLTQFIEGHKYHFAVRAVDVFGRIGPFSSPSSIKLLKQSTKQY